MAWVWLKVWRVRESNCDNVEHGWQRNQSQQSQVSGDIFQLSDGNDAKCMQGPVAHNNGQAAGVTYRAVDEGSRGLIQLKENKLSMFVKQPQLSQNVIF